MKETSLSGFIIGTVTEGEKEKEVVAYKAWVCRYCKEVRAEGTDMWRHLVEKHGNHSVETDCNGRMYGIY